MRNLTLCTYSGCIEHARWYVSFTLIICKWSFTFSRQSMKKSGSSGCCNAVHVKEYLPLSLEQRMDHVFRETSVTHMPPSINSNTHWRSSSSTSFSSSSSICCFTLTQPHPLPIWDIYSSLGIGNDDTSNLTYFSPDKSKSLAILTTNSNSKQPAQKKKVVSSDILQLIKTLDPNNIPINDVKVVKLIDQFSKVVKNWQGQLVCNCDTICNLPAHKFTLNKSKSILVADRPTLSSQIY